MPPMPPPSPPPPSEAESSRLTGVPPGERGTLVRRSLIAAATLMRSVWLSSAAPGMLRVYTPDSAVDDEAEAEAAVDGRFGDSGVSAERADWSGPTVARVEGEEVSAGAVGGRRDHDEVASRGGAAGTAMSRAGGERGGANGIAGAAPIGGATGMSLASMGLAMGMDAKHDEETALNDSSGGATGMQSVG